MPVVIALLFQIMVVGFAILVETIFKMELIYAKID
jgi:hypothetical protein